jgi:hypothetical protein
MNSDKLEIGSLQLGKISINDVKGVDHDIPLKNDVTEITEECATELSGQAKQIAAQEKKLGERMDFDNDRAYYFCVVFKSTKERDAYLKQKGIKLRADTYVFIEDVKDIL